VLTAGGSQIEISGAGVLPTTAGKFESKAGSICLWGVVNVPAIDLPDCSAKQTQAAQNGSAKVDLS
jgi:type VI secretion system secreted protein VgrG